jgi:hypothetical protein
MTRMADEQFDGRTIPPRKPRSPEPLFAFQKGSRVISCGLRCHAKFRVEAQFLEDGELVYRRRFDMRAQAVQWAEIEREAEQGIVDATTL